MPRKHMTFVEAAELYRAAANSIKRPSVWVDYLTSASYNYKLNFDEQIMLFAQAPGAKAVLTADGWRKRFFSLD